MTPPRRSARTGGAAQRRLDEFLGAGTASFEPRAERALPPELPGIWAVQGGCVVHPFLASGEIRALPFQIDLARVGVDSDLLVVLPTGLGKTVIAALVSAEQLRRGPGKAIFLAPTRPLVDQHARAFGRWLPGRRRAQFTGTVRHPVRQGSFADAELVFATPEIVANDLAAGRYTLGEVRLLIFDEAHHAVGRYAYVPIAERYRAERPHGGHVLGLTASPGAADERIEEVVANLGVQRIEARSREDPGVREYVQPVSVDYRWVSLPPTAKAIQGELAGALRETARRVQKLGYLRKKPIAALSVKDLLALRAEVFARPGPMTRKFAPLLYQGVLLHLHQALDRLETQGIAPFAQYVERVRAKPKPGRADRTFLKLPGLMHAVELAASQRRDTTESSHPKLDCLAQIVAEELQRPRDRPARILVFAQYRDTIQGIVERLQAEGHRVGRFVGQATRDADDPGMSQKEQGHALASFRDGRFPILVASSVAEEGLDVPDVDLVVFFEAVPSEIRAIQRRGRTGRSSLGRVIVLLTEATRDIGHQRAEARREQAMRRIVRRLGVRGRRVAAVDGERSAPRTAGPDDGPPPG